LPERYSGKAREELDSLNRIYHTISREACENSNPGTAQGGIREIQASTADLWEQRIRVHQLDERNRC
jgi:hypothetical protein